VRRRQCRRYVGRHHVCGLDGHQHGPVCLSPGRGRRFGPTEGSYATTSQAQQDADEGRSGGGQALRVGLGAGGSIAVCCKRGG
jgi:hypothetical protein